MQPNYNLTGQHGKVMQRVGNKVHWVQCQCTKCQPPATPPRRKGARTAKDAATTAFHARHYGNGYNSRQQVEFVPRRRKRNKAPMPMANSTHLQQREGGARWNSAARKLSE